MKKISTAAILAALAAPAAAEVKSSSPAGFVVESKVTVAPNPAQAWAMLVRIGEWWNPAHSYSGKASSLRLEPKAGGCFCEKLSAGGSVEHMRVVYAEPPKTLRLQGGLGPLQAQAAAGTLTWTLKPVMNGTEIVQTYAVSGYFPDGTGKLAPGVDKVLAEQLARLQQKLGYGR